MKEMREGAHVNCQGDRRDRKPGRPQARATARVRPYNIRAQVNCQGDRKGAPVQYTKGSATPARILYGRPSRSPWQLAWLYQAGAQTPYSLPSRSLNWAHLPQGCVLSSWES